MKRSSAAVKLIWLALIRAAPEHSAKELRRFAVSICCYAALQLAGRLPATLRGTEKARRELDAINADIIKLADRLYGLSPDAQLALEDGRAEIWPMLERLADFNVDIVGARGRLQEQNISPVGGRPRDPAAAAIASRAAKIFTHLTGYEPRRVGPSGGGFDALLVAIFSAMNIEADTDYHIRRLRGKRHEKR